MYTYTCIDPKTMEQSITTHPVGICQMKSDTFAALNAMCALRADSLPFCIAGTIAAARAHNATMLAPANRWGPGNSFPVRDHVFRQPSMAMMTPLARRIEPMLKWRSLNFPFTRLCLFCTRTHTVQSQIMPDRNASQEISVNQAMLKTAELCNVPRMLTAVAMLHL